MPEAQDELRDFEELFRRHYPRLCQRAQRLTGDADAAEDMVQEVFVHFWNNAQRHTITAPEAYLYKAVINKALNYAGSRKRRTASEAQYRAQQPAAANTTEQELYWQELQQKIQLTIEQLPPMCRRVFLLSRYEEMSHKEIADFLHISPNTVDNHIKKALAILRKALPALLLLLPEIYFNFFS